MMVCGQRSKTYARSMQHARSTQQRRMPAGEKKYLAESAKKNKNTAVHQRENCKNKETATFPSKLVLQPCRQPRGKAAGATGAPGVSRKNSRRETNNTAKILTILAYQMLR